MDKCPDCGARIVWLEVRGIGTLPLDAKPTEAFVVVEPEDSSAYGELVAVRTQHRCANPRRVR
jgi:hypothetical protein